VAVPSSRCLAARRISDLSERWPVRIRWPAGCYTVKGAGADIWGTSDNFHYVYVPFTGDGQIIARVAGVQNTNAWAKAGLMFRESLAAGARNAFVAVTPGNGITFQRRTATSSSSANTAKSGLAAPYWLKLVRSGNVFQAFYSATGTTWTQLGSNTTIAMASSIEVGLAVTSHNATALNTSTFDHVSITPYVNLATGKTVTATSTAAGSAAGNAVDASTSTAWTSAAGGSQSLSVDLGSSRSISRVTMAWGSSYPRSYSVQISTDNSTWTPSSAQLPAPANGRPDGPAVARPLCEAGVQNQQRKQLRAERFENHWNVRSTDDEKTSNEPDRPLGKWLGLRRDVYRDLDHVRPPRSRGRRASSDRKAVHPPGIVAHGRRPGTHAHQGRGASTAVDGRVGQARREPPFIA